MKLKIGKVRWIICTLVFFATTINYLDRAVISLLKSTLSNEFSWNDGDYANIEIAFKISYAIGLLFAGRIIDKIGTKKGYGFAGFFWSVSAILHGLASNLIGFIFVRSALGFTESGNFPAAIKTIAEWFPKKERALATGIFNSGANIGAILAPLSVPFIAIQFGWQFAFYITGFLGIIWVYIWYKMYYAPTKHPYLSKQELDYILMDVDTNKIVSEDANFKKFTWKKLLTYKQTWAFTIGKFLTDAIWWFYIFWLPDFLESQYHISGTNIAIPLASVYTISIIGSVGGGYLPLKLIEKGWSVFKARKTSMLIYACCVTPILFAQLAGSKNIVFAIIIIGIAAAAHQAWSANIFTTVSDMFPKSTIATVTGIGSTFGALGGIFLSLFVQKKLFVYYRSLNQIETAYYIMFFWCALAYLLAWIIMHVLVPKVNIIQE
ncbi:MAG: MFS transporter [Sediminibacterium sp.]|nr:MFS transporter [Sediminibacterium sp.]